MSWIKIKDKKPDDQQEVLIFSEGRYMWHASYSKKLKQFNEYCPCAGPFEGKPTHWMPLPEKPKE